MARDYTQLKLDVARWAERDDLDPDMDTFIALAEDIHAWGDDEIVAPPVRVRDMLERDATLTPVDTRFMDFPTGYLGMRRLRLLKSSGPKRLNYVTPENLPYTRAKEPDHYTLHEQVEFDTDSAADHTFEMLFYKRFDGLSASNPTNWLVLNAYGAYLFATLVQVAIFVDDEENRDEWLNRYRAVCSAINEADRRGQQPRGRLQSFNTRVDGTTGLM